VGEFVVVVAGCVLERGSVPRPDSELIHTPVRGREREDDGRSAFQIDRVLLANDERKIDRLPRPISRRE